MIRVASLFAALAAFACLAAPAFAQGQAQDQAAARAAALKAQQENGQKMLAEADEKLPAALEELKQKPEDEAAVEAVVKLYQQKITGANMARQTDVALETYAALADVAVPAVAKFPTNTSIVNAAITCKTMQVSRMQGTADEKLAAVEEFKAFLASINSDNDAVKQAVANGTRTVTSLARSIEAEAAREKLIGAAAPPIPAEAWVNGTPVAAEDLKGKVVFLDFWAVWCGPCIATFPHLKEWNEKYADKGLVMIGATRYYQYGWDDAAGRSVRTENISAEDEQAAMLKFAEHHGLTHRLAVVTDQSFWSNYGVTGIPQAVVIDREGKIRMIKVGSGPANAEALDNLLKELFSTSGSGDE